MGWKNVKDHYRIGHLVQVTSAGLCIGSGYIHDIIVAGEDGQLRKRYDDRSNEELKRYQAEMDADPLKLAELMRLPDQFEKSLPVFTYDGADIIEKRCEEAGWPNVTHDGCMMYDNTYSTDRQKVVAWAKANAASAVRMSKDQLARLRKEVQEWEERLAGYEADAERLQAEHPDTVSESA